MKDIVFLLAILFCLVFVFKKPLIGVCLWVWTALLVPSFLLWGFAAEIRYNLLISIVTIAVIFLGHFKFKNINNRTFWVSFLFVFWTLLSSFSAIGDPLVVSMESEKFIKVYVLFVVVLLVVTEKKHIEAVLMSMLLGLGYYSVTEGAKSILSGGSHRVWGPSTSIIGDNNHFALAVLIILPLGFFVYRNVNLHKFIKWGILGGLILSTAAVFGTYSRGGLIGLIFFAILYSIIFKKKTIVGALAVVLATTYVSFVPQQWVERMDTIKTAEEDNSFMTRVTAWKQSTLVAMDRPFIGGGFKAIEHFPVWIRYAQDFHKLDFVPTMPPNELRSHAAHSIYFQVLGEHGFVGFLLFGGIALVAILNIRKSRKLLKNLKGDHKWHKELSDSLFISLSVYFLVGAALNMAYFDGLYLLFALTQIQLNLVRNELEKQALSSGALAAGS